jgi:hypothetical protein
MVWSAGQRLAVETLQVTAGSWVSLTVTLNVELPPAVLVQVTVVVPTGKNEPDGGEQVIVPQAPPVFGVV